ncbi:MAG: hypothetical protein E4H33_02410, partial [Anaerolineales bacterium]
MKRSYKLDNVVMEDHTMKSTKFNFLLIAAAGLLLAACSKGSPATPQSAALPASSGDQLDILFQDDFSDPASGWKPAWFEGSDPAHAEEYRDGEYRIWVDNDQNKYDISLATPGKSYGDISLEVDVRRVAGDEGASAYLMCRVDLRAASFYYFSLDGMNNASIGVYLDGEEQHVLWKEIPPEVLKSDSNRLRADCLGSSLAVYVNGQLITQTEESDLKLGDVGLGAGGGSQGMTEMFFDNFAVYPGPHANQDNNSGETTNDNPADIVIATGEVTPPPPSGYVNSIEAGVAAGYWSYEQGIIETLKVLIGELESLSLLPELQPQETEGTGVLRLAQDYLANGKDAQAKGEIQRLLGILVPSIERLQEYAAPESQASAKAPGLASIQSDLTDCADLWKDGFPEGGASICFLYAQQVAKAGTLARVYFPAEWAPGDPRRDYSPLALSAAIRALDTYAALGTVGSSVDIVFTLLPAKNPLMLAETEDATSGKSCLIVIFPGAISMDQGKTGQSVPNGAFQQTVAHELAHCFQGWNFFPKGWNFEKQGWNWQVNKWWGEGSAEYLSNLAYPTANYEWRWNSNFDTLSGFNSTFALDYENFIFFQELANRDGTSGVIKLLKLLPVTSTLSAQTDALAGYVNINNLYHQFAQDYIERNVKDTSGAKIPATPQFLLSEQLSIGDSGGQLQLTAPAFTLSKYRLIFTKGTLYSIAATQSGASGQVSASYLAETSAWMEIPGSVPASCQDASLIAVLTTAVPGAGPLVDDLAVKADIKVGCDPCLVGTWDLDLPAFEEYLAAPFQDVEPGFFRIDSLGGIWRLHFSQQAEVKGEFNFLVAYELDQTSEDSIFNLLAQVLLDINGDGTAQYLIDGTNHIIFKRIKDNFSMEQTIFVNGQ